MTPKVFPATLVTSLILLYVPSDILTTVPVPIIPPNQAARPVGNVSLWIVIVDIPVASLKTVEFVVVLFAVALIAVKSNPIVPVKVLVLAPVSTTGMEIQCVPSGEISTVLSNPSSVATNEEVDAEPRNESASEELPLMSGIVLTDSVPRLKVVLP